MKDINVGELLKFGEHLALECKKAESGLPKSVWETYSSFANTSGGTILLGIKENMSEEEFAKRFTVGGVENPERIISDFWNTINSEKVNVNLLVDDDVYQIEYDGKIIIVINVPQASYKSKPVYINGNLLKGAYKRNHEGDYHCTEEEVKAMLRDSNDSGNDGGLVDGYTMGDVDEDTLNAYRIEYSRNNPDHVWNNIDDKDFLRNIGGYTVERETGKEGLTIAGLLMFGKGLSIRERFDNIRMDYIDETNLPEGARWSDRLTYDGMWENNLYNFMKRVMPKLVSNLKRPFKLEGMTRIDDTPIHKAMREAVVNLIIHADYMINGVLKIVKKEDGFLFSNPGNLKLPIHDIYEGGNSVARNPRIQTMFRMIGAGDNIGSGFPTILSAWGNENWRKPDLSENTELHLVELKLWMISMMPAECTTYLQSLIGIDYDTLSAPEQVVLASAYLEKEVSNNRLQSLLNLNPIEIGKVLAQLTQNKYLIMNSRGRWSTYYINSDYVKNPAQIDIPAIIDKSVELNATDKQIFDFAKINGMITTQQVVDITPSIGTTAGASVALNRLIKKGLMKKKRQGRHIFYTLVEK